MEVIFGIGFVFVLVIALIVGFACYADAHHIPATWEQVAARKRHKKYVRENYFRDEADEFYDEEDALYDDEDDMGMNGGYRYGDEDEGADDGMLYGGIPFGDGKLFMTDDDDFIDEFGDDVL